MDLAFKKHKVLLKKKKKSLGLGEVLEWWELGLWEAEIKPPKGLCGYRQATLYSSGKWGEGVFASWSHRGQVM